MKDLESWVTDFDSCFSFMDKGEKTNSDAELTAACKFILRKSLVKICGKLADLRESIVWSMLDGHQNWLKTMVKRLKTVLGQYLFYENETFYREKINEINCLIEEATNGFRQSYTGGGYYLELFRREQERYRAENAERLERVYLVDYEDKIAAVPDDARCRIEMVADRRRNLFATPFGKYFHDQGLAIEPLAAHIISRHEPDYSNIHEFMDKYIAYQIAKERCTGAEQEPAFRNIVFKENVDVDQVMRKLQELVKDKTISAQKHWFIVFKVFTEKGWLANTKQSSFTEQINITFRNVLKCSVEDFRKVEAYFKNKNFEDWTLDDRIAPSCCDMYRSIADKLDHEFQELKYAKPGRLINTGKSRKSV